MPGDATAMTVLRDRVRICKSIFAPLPIQNNSVYSDNELAEVSGMWLMYCLGTYHRRLDY